MAAATPSLSLNSGRWFTVADGSRSNQDLGVHGRRWFTDLGVQSMVLRSAKKMVVACRVDVHDLPIIDEDENHRDDIRFGGYSTSG
ncbi:hypothetical protein L6452_35790 [Arctium lappa]|uniref:Uncharacterized protein n=1 Tax=Arctium lappa TaxID=4217 RepID=A0ACB8Y8J9_ARCLA|nr:hypothetical protein L6452_35790 [Arctium lappa]